MKTLPIRTVTARTGLTARALRLYEAKGLVQPGRSWKGARLYAPQDLERLARIVALKHAGLTLAQIAALLSGRTPDLAQLIDAQLAALAERRRGLDRAVAALRTARAEIARGATLDAQTLCRIIAEGEKTMTEQDWKRVIDRNFTAEQQAHWAEKLQDPRMAGFQSDDYGAKWADLASRIEAALPHDPSGSQAQAFWAEWQALLAPFNAVADDQMKREAFDFYDRSDETFAGGTAPFSKAVWEAMKAAARAQRAAAAPM